MNAEVKMSGMGSMRGQGREGDDCGKAIPWTLLFRKNNHELSRSFPPPGIPYHPQVLDPHLVHRKPERLP